MTNSITPPLELVQQWYMDATGPLYEKEIAIRAAQYGADQELEACIDWFADARNHGFGYDYAKIISAKLRAARRRKPPSLKEQALRLLETYNTSGVMLTADQADTIRRALEVLDD
jgi:hypothetical protein